MTEYESAKLLAAKAAIKLLQENHEIIEEAESFEMTLTVPIPGTQAKAHVTLTVKIGD